jgi:hypothetical protein
VRILLPVAVAPLALTAFLLSGCSGFSRPTPTENLSNSVQGTALRGIVHGGRQPIVGAHVYLYAANTNGYGQLSMSLLTSGPGRSEDSNHNYYVTSGTSGTFSIAGDYNCPAENSQVYLYAIGGDPGSGATNSAAGLMVGLGSCGALSATEFIVVNEVSTVATAYAIAGFATDATHVSSSGTALAEAGIANAFSAVTNLGSLGDGTAKTATHGGNGAPPNQEVNTLADILAACVNSTGPSSTGCSTLFTNAMNGATAPTETATAAINIAHNPGSNIDNLFALATADGPFQPTLPAPAPNDFTIAITYSGGGLDGSGRAPNGIAIDGSGNVWVPNLDSNTISEFKYDGTAISNFTGPCNNYFCSAGLSQPSSVAIDIDGNAWVANFNGTSISEFNSAGYGISGPPGYEGSGLNDPYGIAIDSTGHTWVANFGGNNLSEFTYEGTALSGEGGFAVGALVGPAGIASDTSGNVWTVNFGGNLTENTYLLVETNSRGAQTSDPNGYAGGGLNLPYGVAIDGGGNVWVSNQLGGSDGNGSVSEFGSTGCTPPATFCAESGSTGFSGGGVDGPNGIAIDGLGNVWTADKSGWSISEFNSSGTAISPDPYGYFSAGIVSPYSIAIDPSGNVWVANDNGNASLTEFVGAAAPVVTPLAAGAEYNELGIRP